MSACDCGKIRYYTRRQAKRVARQIPGTRRLRAYACGGFWHLTSESTGRTTMWRAWERPGTGDRP